MAEKIGRFEIASQLAQSALATVYKALDPESQQDVALKVVHLDRVKDRSALLKQVFEEADQAKSLNSPNIAGLYGVGDEGDLLLAAMEYVQGVSVATTLARHDGFSIWDLQDITRQVCHALDHAEVHKAVHRSLEPAKVMVQWDGMVKVLAFGTSLMNSQAMELSGAVPEVLHYASPEQLRGEKCDHRSALFSLGAILYEMATEQKAFPGETPDQIRTAILEGTPPLPQRLKANFNPALSALIMKAISKSPDERFQSGQELVRDMEQCKAGVTSSAAPVVAPTATKPPAKAVAMAAGAGAAGAPTNSSVPSPKGSAAAGTQRAKSRVAVDPMMAEAPEGATAPQSFSEISELPPLKEVYSTPPPPRGEDAPEAPEPALVLNKATADKPRVQVREAAQKAVREIRRTPPKLYLYGVGCAVFVIAIYLGGMAFYNYTQDHDSSAVTLALPQSTATATAPQSQAPPTSNAAQTQTEKPDENQSAGQPEPEEAAAAPDARHSHGKRARARAVSAIVPVELSISSTPAGAQITFDGAALCQTPCTLTGIAPGQHVIAATRAGYASATRNLAMLSGANSSVSLELSPLGATLSVASTPAGAVILIDGKDSGKLTPSQFSFSKSGSHNVTLRRAGYLDQSSAVNVEAGQPSAVNLKLAQLGNTEEIRSAGGKFKKVFGRGADTSDMGTVSIKTQPKGAQIMINNRVLDKTTPFDFYLNPGTYVIDVTLSGYQTLHRVITVQEGEKLAIQETLASE
ncbi:MAG TPA: PEGA domain-containing protein [Terriglobales bacterium]|nr:PEGA domain-containing protein [Terriglobales bacterium]